MKPDLLKDTLPNVQYVIHNWEKGKVKPDLLKEKLPNVQYAIHTWEKVKVKPDLLKEKLTVHPPATHVIGIAEQRLLSASFLPN